jgi:hypothetical protein
MRSDFHAPLPGYEVFQRHQKENLKATLKEYLYPTKYCAKSNGCKRKFGSDIAGTGAQRNCYVNESGKEYSCEKPKTTKFNLPMAVRNEAYLDMA